MNNKLLHEMVYEKQNLKYFHILAQLNFLLLFR